MVESPFPGDDRSPEQRWNAVPWMPLYLAEIDGRDTRTRTEKLLAGLSKTVRDIIRVWRDIGDCRVENSQHSQSNDTPTETDITTI